MTLPEFFALHPVCALGLSGGVDSAYLLYAATQLGAQGHPYYIKTAFQPQFELDDAQRLCTQLGVTLTVLDYDISTLSAVVANPADRCYYCKTALFSRLKAAALADGCSVLLDGTNASDDADDRPGMRALRELKVYSPLRDCGLTKTDIRRLSKEAGLFTWDKPAYACLATRIPTGQPITIDLLYRVEQAEKRLFALGFTDFRVRVFHDAARIQLPEGQLPQAITQRSQILDQLKPLFFAVLLDFEVR